MTPALEREALRYIRQARINWLVARIRGRVIEATFWKDTITWWKDWIARGKEWGVRMERIRRITR